jgi:hypothetical protein
MNAANKDVHPAKLGGERIDVLGAVDSCGGRLSARDHTPECAARQADGLSALLEVTELQERLHGELCDLYAGRANWHHRQQEHARYLRSRLERWLP